MSGKRILRVFSTMLSSSADKVFPLLCPVREYDWIPHWQCDLLYSNSGYAELGCVFKTDFKDHSGPETWVVCNYEINRQIGFVKTGTHTTARYTVSLEPNQTGSTIRWEQEVTSLDDHGDILLDKMTEHVYEEKMKQINTLLDYYLLHGKTQNEQESYHR